MENTVKIARILHAGYVFDHEATQIAFDPIFENPFSRNCHAFPHVAFDRDKIRQLRLDAVFISHYHDDHCSFDSLDLLPRTTPLYVFCIHDELFVMLRELGFTDVHSLQLNLPVVIGSITVTPRRALDSEVDSLFHIHAAGLNILNVVDAWIDDETMDLLAKQSWDVILWPFQTMREMEVLAPTRAEPASKTLPPEWKAQWQRLRPRLLVPSSCQFLQESWSWYNYALFPVSYAQFQREVETVLPDCRVWRLDPSCAMELAAGHVQESSRLDWVTLVGPQGVDYQYQEDRPPMPTAEIAQQFPALTENQRKHVEQFCREDILARYENLDDFDDYFEKNRQWQLSVYDHLGREARYNYSLTGKIISGSEADDSPGWTTEIPAAKLWGALNAGESLTSLYVRINARDFGAVVEKELLRVDILEDPLVRCLFSNEFGAYQREQLHRLKKG